MGHMNSLGGGRHRRWGVRSSLYDFDFAGVPALVRLDTVSEGNESVAPLLVPSTKLVGL